MNIVNYDKKFVLKKTLQELPKDEFSKVLNYESLVKQDGDKGLRKVNELIGLSSPLEFKVSKEEILKADRNLDEGLKSSILIAKANIESYAKRQYQTLKLSSEDTTRGISLWSEIRPIDRVGLYIPGGSAPLFSSLLMQAIPAKVAGCKNIYVCTPPNEDESINQAILWICYILNITNVYKIGGSQAIFALANGTESIAKVDKIFGPGNLYVTAAKK